MTRTTGQQQALPPESSTDSAQVSEAVEEELLCPGCGHANPPGQLHCGACWVRLSNRRLPTREQVVDMVRRRGRQRRVRRTISLIALALLLGLVGFYLFTFLYVPALPTATTQVSSASTVGEAAMEGLNPGHTAATAQGPELQGILAWRFEAAEGLLASPAVVDGIVYQPTGDGRMVALDARSGQPVWQHPTTGPVDSSPAVADGLVYYGRRDGKLVALEAKNGEVAWEYPADGPISASPVVHEGVVYIGTTEGTLLAVDAQTGERLWKRRLNKEIRSPIALNEEILVVAASSGDTYVLDRRTGKQRLLFDVGALLQTAPVIAGHQLFLGASGGKLMAVDWRQREYPLERAARYWRFHFWVWGFEKDPPIPKGYMWNRGFWEPLFRELPCCAGGCYVRLPQQRQTVGS